MEKPVQIRFQDDSLKVLCSDLLAVAPEEGCALLICDKEDISNPDSFKTIKITFVWPCCNIWSEQADALIDSSRLIVNSFKKTFSRRNRFLIDPYEQIYAQKWTRERNMQVIGSAHSHPQGSSTPSEIDLNMTYSDSLMVIVNGLLDIRAWWLTSDRRIPPQELEYLSDK